MLTYEEENQLNFNFLDTLDLEEIFRESKTPDKPIFFDSIYFFMDSVENYVKDNQIKIPDELQNEVFNFINELDFIDYLHKRYPDSFVCRQIIEFKINFKNKNGELA